MTTATLHRAVALSYTLLGGLFFAGALVLISLTWPPGSPVWHKFGLGTTLSIYLGTAFAFWIIAWMSLRYVSFSAPWRAITLAVSLLLTLSGILAASKVTTTGSTASGLTLWWGLACVCTVCSFLLLRYRRASNNRWSDRERL